MLHDSKRQVKSSLKGALQAERGGQKVGQNTLHNTRMAHIVTPFCKFNKINLLFFSMFKD